MVTCFNLFCQSGSKSCNLLVLLLPSTGLTNSGKVEDLETFLQRKEAVYAARRGRVAEYCRGRGSNFSQQVLYCTVLYYTVLYCTVLYCTVLCCTVRCILQWRGRCQGPVLLSRTEAGRCHDCLSRGHVVDTSRGDGETRLRITIQEFAFPCTENI